MYIIGPTHLRISEWIKEITLVKVLALCRHSRNGSQCPRVERPRFSTLGDRVGLGR